MSAIVLPGDCRKIIAGLADQSIDAIVTDPPYELGFMGKRWDASGVAYDVDLWAECLRVLKPGGHLLAFGGTRTYHRMTVAIEDAGFEIRDSIHWLYGSGFPKSLDVSKAIDKQRHDRAEILAVTAWVRAARDAAGITNRDIDDAFGFVGMAGHWTSAASQPAVPTLEQVPTLLDVLGVALDDVPDEIRRLLWELNGRKGQPGENWARREVVGERMGIVSNGGGRYNWHAEGTEGRGGVYDITAPATDAARQWEGWGTALKPAHEPIVVARKPLVGTVAANVLEHGTGALNIDGCRVAFASEDDEQESEAKNQHADFGTKPGGNAVYGDYSMVPAKNYNPPGRWPANLAIDDVIAGRHPEWGHYFYTAKPSRRERNADDTVNNRHPTVKPLALMRWLVRLVTPPGGVVLDPFAGSGTTLVAAILEGFDAVGCEMTDDYLPIIDGRIAWAQAERAKEHPNLFGGAA